MGRLTLSHAPGRRAAGVVALLVLLLGATACGERSEPTGTTVDLYPVTVQSGDRPLVVAGPARRIAAMDEPARALIRSLGAGPRLVGPPPGSRLDVAALRRARPDLIVASGETGEQAVSRAAAATRAAVYVAAGDSIRQVERAITQLGLLTGRPVRARALVRHIEARRRQAAVKLAGVPPVTVFVDTGYFTTVPGHSLAAELVGEAHGTPVGEDTADGGPVELRNLLALDPDVYLATSDSGVTLADLRRNRQTRKLRAVKRGRFAVVDAALLQPGAQVGDAVLELARLLHPNAVR
jgi:ABC-type Fe3+-hydroxamate transport system substrate-binding protein